LKLFVKIKKKFLISLKVSLLCICNKKQKRLDLKIKNLDILQVFYGLLKIVLEIALWFNPQGFFFV
jgi:hypothetical protein